MTRADVDLEEPEKEVSDPYRPGGRSFTWDKTQTLIRFSIARADAPIRVLHLHGRYDEIESIILDERSYQNLYLDRSAEWRFRETMVGLILSSTPIVFIGHSLGDEDIGRYLRDRRQNFAQPMVFGVFDRADDPAGDEATSMWRRYGLMTLWYDSRNANSGNDDPKSAALTNCLRSIAAEANTAALDRLRVPSPKRPVAGQRRPLTIELPLSAHGEDIAQDVVKELRRRSLVIVRGRSGTGRTRVLDRAVRHYVGDTNSNGAIDERSSFFWTATSEDDLTTLLQRLWQWAEIPGEPAGFLTFFERFAAGGEGRVLALDGLESLAEDDYPGARALSQSAADVMNGVRSFATAEEWSERTGNRIVITSGHDLFAWSEAELCEQDKPGGWTRIHLPQLPERSLAIDFEPPRVETAWRELQCELGYEEHMLSVARQHVTGSGAILSRIRDIHDRSVLARPDGQRKAVFEAVLDECSKLQRRLLDIAAFTAMPLPAYIFEWAAINTRGLPDKPAALSAAGRTVPSSEDAIDEAYRRTIQAELEDLRDRRLLFAPDPEVRYSMSDVLRRHILVKRHGAHPSQWAGRSVRGTTSPGVSVAPGHHAAGLVELVCENLLAQAEQLSLDDDEHTSEVTMVIQAVLTILRSRAEARSPSPERRVRDLLRSELRLLNLIRRLTPVSGSWSSVAGLTLLVPGDADGPLHLEDLLWLHNDIALGSYITGRVDQAEAMFGLSKTLAARVGQINDSSEYEAQSALQFANLSISKGALHPARKSIALARSHARELTGPRRPDYLARIAGYEAILSHIQGDAGHAQKCFADSLFPYRRYLPTHVLAGFPTTSADDHLNLHGESDAHINNPRAASRFLTHYAHLGLDDQSRWRDCEGLLRTALGLAQGVQSEELAILALLGLAELARRVGDRDEADARLGSARNRTAAAGFVRLEIEVHSQAAKNSLSVGNIEAAADAAYALLRSTTSLGLRLRQTGALELLGQAYEARGERRIAIAYLTYALRRARRQGYVRREVTIADRLRRLDPDALARAHGVDDRRHRQGFDRRAYLRALEKENSRLRGLLDDHES